MTKYELIEQNEDRLMEEIVDEYRYALKDRLHHDIYIWSDGKIELFSHTGNSWLKAKDWEKRKLYYVCDVYIDSSFDVWSGYDANEETEDEYIEELVDWFRHEELFDFWNNVLNTAKLD